MQVRKAESWSHLQDLLFEDAWNERLQRHRSPWVFRGLSDIEFPMTTSLMRLGGPFEKNEQNLLRNFKKYAHREAVEVDSFWHWISLAQHHGLPTRLLDWTYSPFVAMHFATNNSRKFDRDGVIWCINYERTHQLLPTHLHDELTREGANSFTTDLLDNAVPSFREFDEMTEETVLLFFEPPSMDDRIVNQYAIFSVLSDLSEGMNPWISAHPELVGKIIIPSSLKWEVRDKLDQSNITERVLYPGLDGLSKWLSRHYSPR